MGVCVYAGEEQRCSLVLTQHITYILLYCYCYSSVVVTFRHSSRSRPVAQCSSSQLLVVLTLLYFYVQRGREFKFREGLREEKRIRSESVFYSLLLLDTV